VPGRLGESAYDDAAGYNDLTQEETRMFRFVLISLALLAPLGDRLASAGEFNKKLSIGDAAPDWTGLEGVDGKKLGLADFKGKDAVVVVFTCNHCPFAMDHEDRIIAFTKKYANGPNSKVAVVAISVDLNPCDNLEKMKERAKEKGFKFPYLHDPSQQTGRDYGARVTPVFFVLNKDHKIAYMGAMDDDPSGEKVTVKYLENAVDAILKGEKPAKAETLSQGCGIEYQKKK
jgi:peroxiredoxin